MADAALEPAAASCRNCGAPAGDAYCPRCGQETAALPPARQFLKDAAGRYVALDGRLWRTLFALFFRPGFLTLEYLAGRRRRYVRPARLFLVLSLLVFATIRLVVDLPRLDGAITVDRASAPPKSEKDAVPRDQAALQAESRTTTRTDTAGPVLLPGVTLHFDDKGELHVDGAGAVAKALEERIARFNALPRQERLEQTVLGVLRYGPYAMFALLPAFAFLLMVVHRRSRRAPQRPRLYAEHLVFAAHNHAFLFLAVTLMVVVPWAPLRGALALWCLAYALWSLRVVYGGHWVALLARSWVVAITYFVLFAFVMVGLLLTAVLLR
ncbi:MAG: DUF3667 domain-containing protein [Betaproteobacteria bacterium]|nr:DUF3667 domain-containing protein [Betaproteobacteria bacterium]MDH5286360.1 DUF3667 domain-containing protein [Betaproteobacteria bacterium]